MKENLLKFFRSFKYAFCGIVYVAKTERNFRFHLAMALYVIFFAIIGKVTLPQFGVLCVCIALVLTAELFNTALELTCDKITKEQNVTIKHIKDISAGAVLISAVFSAMAGLFIFLSKDVFFRIFDVLFTYPWLLVLFIVSVIFNLIFIFKKSGR